MQIVQLLEFSGNTPLVQLADYDPNQAEALYLATLTQQSGNSFKIKLGSSWHLADRSGIIAETDGMTFLLENGFQPAEDLAGIYYPKMKTSGRQLFFDGNNLVSSESAVSTMFSLERQANGAYFIKSGIEQQYIRRNTDGHFVLGGASAPSGSDYEFNIVPGQDNSYKIQNRATGEFLYESPNLSILASLSPEVGQNDFLLEPAITDGDGNIYTSLRIGNQSWLAQNLRTTTYNDGSAIPTNDVTWYQNNQGFQVPYGALYKWNAIAGANNPCPKGWHIPDEDEWQTLVSNYATSAEAYIQLRKQGPSDFGDKQGLSLIHI